MTDSVRRCRLLGATSAVELLEQVKAEANEAAATNTICLQWRAAENKEGYGRVEATIPLTASTFDLLFNGRMGYRAQYYRSVEDGRVFNRRLVDHLTEVVRAKLESGLCQPRVEWTHAEQSLKGPHSKVWIVDDWAVFRGEPPVLRPARWVEYWSNSQDEALGLAAPLPDEGALDLKGTFICADGKPWLPQSKEDRDEKICRSGWT